MRSHRHPGFVGLVSRLALAVIVMASLLGKTAGSDSRSETASPKDFARRDSAARGASRRRTGDAPARTAATAVLWLVGGSLVGLGLLLALLSIGTGFLANLGISLVFCMAPGAILFALGAAVYRRRFVERSRDSEVEIGAAQRDSGSTTASASETVPPVINVEKGGQKPAYYRERAASYRRRLQSIIKKRRPGPIADVLAEVVAKLTRWEERVGQLADRLNAFETDSIIQRDIKEVPGDITRLERQLVRETDPDLQQQIARTLDAYRAHRTQLETLVRLLRRTRFQLDDTLAAMGTIYSQVQVVDAMDLDGARAVQIGEEIQEQVDRLNDLLSAMTEAYEQHDDVGEAARRIRLAEGRGEVAR